MDVAPDTQPPTPLQRAPGECMSARQVAIATIVILGILFLAYLLYSAQEVLILLFLGILVASAIEPLVERLRRGPFSRGQGVLVVYTMIVGVLALLAVLVVPSLIQQIASFADELPRRLDDARDQVNTIGPKPFRDVATHVIAWAQSTLAGGAATTPSGAPSAAESGAGSSTPVPTAVVNVGLTVLNIVVGIVTIFVIAYYWLVERASLKRTVLRLTGPKHARRVNLLWIAIEARLGAWVRGQLLLMAMVGVGLGVGYVVLGIPGALPLALWAGVAEMIPMLGPYLGVAPALLVALTVSPTTAVLLAVYAIIIQSIEGYVLVPRVMGHAVGVSPLVVFLGILVGAALGGLTGAFLAVPVAGALQVILQDLLSTDTEVTEEAEEAGATEEVPSGPVEKTVIQKDGEPRTVVLPPHAHPVLPGGEVAPNPGGVGLSAAATNKGTPSHASPSKR